MATANARCSLAHTHTIAVRRLSDMSGKLGQRTNQEERPQKPIPCRRSRFGRQAAQVSLQNATHLEHLLCRMTFQASWCSRRRGGGSETQSEVPKVWPLQGIFSDPPFRSLIQTPVPRATKRLCNARPRFDNTWHSNRQAASVRVHGALLDSCTSFA